MLDFEETEEFYHDMEALFKITFDGEADEESSLEHLTEVLELLAEYDVYYSSDIGQEARDASDLANDMIVILVLAGVVIVGVLLFTSTVTLPVTSISPLSIPVKYSISSCPESS